MPEPSPTRTIAVLWGTAHLAWGVAVFLSMLMAAQQMPVESSPRMDLLSLTAFMAGLVYLGVIGWLHVDRGWKLRRPTNPDEPMYKPELASYVLTAAVMACALLRGEQSRLLATGLDRLGSAIFTVSTLSALLWLAMWIASSGIKPRPSDVLSQRMTLATLIVGSVVTALVAALEAMSW